MGHFNIDIERFYQENESIGKKVLGIFCIQYPIYCIHANIKDATPDPINNIDKIIVDFISSNANLTAHQIGTLIGSSKKFVEIRIDALIHDGIIENKDGHWIPTANSKKIFKSKEIKRAHRRSCDFYLDGIDFKPLPSFFYTFYRSNLISEGDVSIHTNKHGKTFYTMPFGPDIVHTPPNKDKIVSEIFSIVTEERFRYNIPEGLEEINEISFTKLGFQLLVAVTKQEGKIFKELIDGFAVHSLNEKLSYLDSLKERVKQFEPHIANKIANLEFRLSIPIKRFSETEVIPILTTNWPEIDRYKNSQDKCFDFSSEDLLRAIHSLFHVPHVDEKDITHSETELEVNISKKTLTESTHRQKVIGDLIRKRDYKFSSVSNNVFIIYLHYNAIDSFVLECVNFKLLVDGFSDKKNITYAKLGPHKCDFTHTFRELAIATGEFEILEQLDIAQFMTTIH